MQGWVVQISTMNVLRLSNELSIVQCLSVCWCSALEIYNETGQTRSHHLSLQHSGTAPFSVHGRLRFSEICMIWVQCQQQGVKHCLYRYTLFVCTLYPHLSIPASPAHHSMDVDKLWRQQFCHSWSHHLESLATRSAVNWHITDHLQKETENIIFWRWHVAAHLRHFLQIWGI